MSLAKYYLSALVIQVQVSDHDITSGSCFGRSSLLKPEKSGFTPK